VCIFREIDRQINKNRKSYAAYYVPYRLITIRSIKYGTLSTKLQL